MLENPEKNRTPSGMSAVLRLAAGWVQWDRAIPGWQRYLWWGCVTGGLGMVLGVFATAGALAIQVRLREWSGHPLTGAEADDREFYSIIAAMAAACIGALVGTGAGLLIAWLRRQRRT